MYIGQEKINGVLLSNRIFKSPRKFIDKNGILRMRSWFPPKNTPEATADKYDEMTSLGFYAFQEQSYDKKYYRGAKDGNPKITHTPKEGVLGIKEQQYIITPLQTCEELGDKLKEKYSEEAETKHQKYDKYTLIASRTSGAEPIPADILTYHADLTAALTSFRAEIDTLVAADVYEDLVNYAKETRVWPVDPRAEA